MVGFDERFITDVTFTVTLAPSNVSEIMWPRNEYDSDLIWMFYQNGINVNRKCAQFGQSDSFIFAFHIVLRIFKFKIITAYNLCKPFEKHHEYSQNILFVLLFGNHNKTIVNQL